MSAIDAAAPTDDHFAAFHIGQWAELASSVSDVDVMRFAEITGAISVSQCLRFVRAVRIGDTITARGDVVVVFGTHGSTAAVALAALTAPIVVAAQSASSLTGVVTDSARAPLRDSQVTLVGSLPKT